MTVTHTYTQEELDEILSVPGAREDSAVIVAIHQAQAQEVTALEATVAAAMEHAASSQLLIEAGKAAGKPHFCETCYKCFARRADRDRHTNSVHLKIKAFVCPFLKKVEGKKERKPCGKAYAQKTSLTVHMLTHKTAEEDKKPFICCMALETGLSCLKRFGDPSSFSRHRREQHKGATYQCPFPGCLDRAKKPKRIKRQSEFKKHLVEKHNLTLEELRLFQVLDSDNFEPTAGPSKPRKTTRKARSHKSRLPSPPPMYSYAASPAAYSSESPAPPSYSATPYAGEIPAICASSEDGYASTPGLTLCSPSPSPSVREAACEFNAEPSVPPPCYPGFERCPDYSIQPYPQEKDMSTYVTEAAAGMGLLLSDSDLNNMSYASGLNHISFDSLPDMPQLFDQSFMNDKPGPTQPPYADVTNSYYEGVPFEMTYQLSGYGYSGEYAQWDMPVAELAEPYVDQSNVIIPPSLLHYDPSSFGIYDMQ